MSCRRLVARPGMASLLVALTLAAFAAAGCSEDTTEPKAKPDTVAGTDEVSGGSDGTGSSDTAATTDDTGDTISTGTDAIAKTDDTAVTDTDSTDVPDGTDQPDGSDTPDGTGTDGDTAAETDTSIAPDVAKLKLPDCAKDNCANCATKCAVQEICVDGKTYKNDCEAICALQSFDWPATYDISPKKCPDCAACANVELKCDATAKKCVYGKTGDLKTLAKACTKNADCVGAAAVCATIKSGAQITVELPCDVECLELKPSAADPTKPVPPTNGACKSQCSSPAGGGCPMNLYQPVCAKQDGKTYANECALQNCDTQGCYAVGSSAKTDACVADAMSVECVGECFADAAAPNCSAECNPTCGILPTGKGQSFRNACLAAAKSATVGNCDGITATEADKCSAGESYKGTGCCAGVDYTSVNPICAMRQEDGGKPAVWLTFRNQSEYDCLTKGDNMWVQQYVGPCVCNCNQNGPEVCGADGLTYTNKCQAECYNPGGQFSTTPGACP